MYLIFNVVCLESDSHHMDPRVLGPGLGYTSYLDNAFRCVTYARLFKEATSKNAVMALKHAIKEFGTPATILLDNGSCFVGRGGHKKQADIWTPALFENELLNLNIGLISSRPYHPQTDGKLERFHRALRRKYGTIEDWMTISSTATRTGCTFHWTPITTRRC